MSTDDSADMRLGDVLENCIFYIFPMYEFLHSLGQNAKYSDGAYVYRGRDASYLAPPAQIRASGIPARGSHLGCLTAKRTSGQG